MAEIIFTENSPKPQGAYSQAVKSNGFVFVSGQIPVDIATGIICVESVMKETRIIFDNISSVLNAAGSSLEKIVKLTVFLKNLDDIKFVNEVMNERFGDNLPARAVVEVSRLPKDISLEIEAIAEA